MHPQGCRGAAQARAASCLRKAVYSDPMSSRLRSLPLLGKPDNALDARLRERLVVEGGDHCRVGARPFGEVLHEPAAPQSAIGRVGKAGQNATNQNW